MCVAPSSGSRRRPPPTPTTRYAHSITNFVVETHPLMRRLAPRQLLNGSDEPVSTLTQDFHTRLDNLLRTLVHAKPHFVRCIRPNVHESLTEFDRVHVAQQVLNS